MASAKLAPILDDLIGSIGPDTFSHTRAVLVCKNKSWPGSAGPFNPSLSQLNIRTLFREAAINWNLLNVNDVTSWNNLAQDVTWYNKFKEPYNPSGQQLYCSCSFNRRLIGEAILTTAPDKPIVYSLNPAAFSFATTGADLCEVQFLGQTTHANTRHLIFASVCSPTGRSYGGNLYRYCEFVPELTADGYEFSASYANVFGALITTLKIFCKLIPIDTLTGFSSNPIYYTAIVDA